MNWLPLHLQLHLSNYNKNCPTNYKKSLDMYQGEKQYCCNLYINRSALRKELYYLNC